MYPSSFLVFLPRSAFGLLRVCILPFTACLPLWAGEMRVRRSKTSRVEMKVDYLSLCYRGSDNPAFIWFCDFLSKASRLSCDYQSRALCLSDGTSATLRLVGRAAFFLVLCRAQTKGCVSSAPATLFCAQLINVRSFTFSLSQIHFSKRL